MIRWVDEPGGSSRDDHDEDLGDPGPDLGDDIPMSAAEVTLVDCSVVRDAETDESCVMLTVECDGEFERFAFNERDSRQLMDEIEACLAAIDDESGDD